MTDRLLAPAAMATLLCLTTTATLAQTSAQTSAQTPATMSPEQGWWSIARCAQENTERARHTCLDRVLREAGLLTNEMHARQQRNAFGLADKPASASPPATASTAAPASTAVPAPKAATAPTVAPSPAAAAPPPATVAPARAAAAPPATPAPLAEPDRLDVELTKVEKAVNGRLFVTTTDGAVWLQAESVDMPQPPVAGDRMTIRKGSMGGYRCSVASTHLTYRCTRNR